MKRWLPGRQIVQALPRSGLVRVPPSAVLALLFLALIVSGGALLKLPFATTHPVGWLDALFTASSAVTVTGLVVVDTGTGFTLFGQIVILLLIQLGGLGLMTFAVLVLSLLGQGIRLRDQILLREDLNQTSLGDLVRLVRLLATLVIGAEAIGTVLLALRWVPEMGWHHGLWFSLFHSISAFNNAGFGLRPDSLVKWATDPLVNLVICALIILGGLGFSVVSELRDRRHWRRFTLHTRLMLAGTAGLLAWSFVAFLMLEWHNPQTLGAYGSIGDRLLIAFFQAVTTRTAGFNTIDISRLTDGTSLMFISLMFVGGGSTSTAGGIKVTTFMVLLMTALAFVRSQPEPTAFGRSIRPSDILKVLALSFMSLLVVMIGAFLLVIVEKLPFLDLAFESVSAFGTVGLSRGATPHLDAFGRLLIMVEMFIGRTGPLALGLALATARLARVRYPRGRVFIG